MSTRRAKAPASSADPRPGSSIDRRTFLATALAVGLAPRTLWADEERGPLSKAARSALPKSEFVYVSPLRSDGSESRCHAEVWYGWLDERVVLITSKETWKARSVARGLDRARIWVGSYGRSQGPFGGNDDFRKGPSFVARAETSDASELLERLLVIFEGKYPDEIGTWKPRFREGLASGERILIRYEPVPS